MKAQFKYVHRPANEKWDYLHNLDSQANARVIMSEKINIPLQILLESISTRNFETEVLYPNNTDIAIYQSCPELTNHLFGLHSKIMIVRAFLFSKKNIKQLGKGILNIESEERILETYFRQSMSENFTQLSKVESIMTGLLAIPLSGKQKLLSDLSVCRDKFIKSLKFQEDGQLDIEKIVVKKHILCEDMPIINIYDSFRVLLKNNKTLGPIDLLLSSDFTDKEFVNFKTKVMLYETGVLKLCK